MITATEITQMGFIYKYTFSDQSIDLCILWDAYHELFFVFGDFYVSGMQNAEVTKSLKGPGKSFSSKIVN